MKLNEMAMAKAVASVNAVIYAACWIWAKAATDSLLWLGNLWAHSVDLAAIPMKRELSLEMGIVGLISWTLFTGLMGYLIARFYNRMAEK